MQEENTISTSETGLNLKELFEVDPNFTRAIQLSKIAQKKGIEHPKISLS